MQASGIFGGTIALLSFVRIRIILSLQSLVGMVVLGLIGYALSSNRRAINWRIVLSAFLLQLLFGAFVLYVSFGKAFLETLANGVLAVLSSAESGIRFLFGDYAIDGPEFVFAIQVLPIIVFFASLISVLYHLGIMERIVKIIGGFIQKILGTTKAESMVAATNIFIGQSEAPIAIKPFLSKMTSSEIFAVMVCGMATVSGSVLGGYAAAGVEMKYLIAASFMAAPAGLMMAKLIVPEDQSINSDSFEIDENLLNERSVNVIDAAAKGALQGLQLALSIGALLLAFIGLIALVNLIIGWLGGLFNFSGLSLQQILGFILQPLAFLIGVPWDETRQVGSLLGQKLVLNEFIAYMDFVRSFQGELRDRTEAIVTFALCGFACFTSIAIVVGGIGLLVPEKREIMTRLGLKAVAAATLANLMSATVAGFFLSL